MRVRAPAAAMLSPSMAQRREPPASTTSTRPSPGSSKALRTWGRRRRARPHCGLAERRSYTLQPFCIIRCKQLLSAKQRNKVIVSWCSKLTADIVLKNAFSLNRDVR